MDKKLISSHTFVVKRNTNRLHKYSLKSTVYIHKGFHEYT